MTHHFYEIFHNQILMITLSVWALAQGMKVLLGIARERRFNFRWLIGTGGMPSSHAAGAAAMATACGLHAGFHSVVFALAAVFALVTMFDAQGVRRSTGQQAEVLNRILEDIYWRGKIESNKLVELIGHTPIQVLTGAVIGICLAIILYDMWVVK